MINVLFIIWSLEKGGAERFLVSLAKNLNTSKIKATVCCLNWKGRWATELEEKGIPVIALNKKGKLDFVAFRKLVEIIKESKFDIVNTHLWTADVFGRLAAICAGTKIIISTAQNVDIWKQWWHRFIDKLLVSRTAQIIAVSEAVKEYYHKKIGIPLNKITVIPNAVEVEKFETKYDITKLYDEFSVSPNDFILACIGRLSEQKGQKYLLEAMSLLRNDYPQLKVLFVGYGEKEKSLNELAHKLNIYNSVRFLGYRSDIPQILQLSNALVLPSLYEGLPLCVLEAMAAARPVITTKIGGVQNLVVNGETGYTVAPADGKALAISISNLINFPENSLLLGIKGKELVVNNYSIKKIADQTSDLLSALLKDEKTSVN